MNLREKLFFVLILIYTSIGLAQEQTDLKSEFTEITKPSILSTHPLGLLFMRLEGKFKAKPTNKIIIDPNLASGNVWSPPVVAYIPNTERDRDFVRKFPWHAREFTVDVDTLDAKSIETQNDGVIKALNFSIDIPLNKMSELTLKMKAFLLTKGKSPFSIFTNDAFIEGFHSAVAGGEDPFDRKLYPYNKARIRYNDRNNNVMDLKNGDFVFSGIEANYSFFPKFEKLNAKGYFLNVGSHLGINTSKYNSSTDLGLNGNFTKSFTLKNPHRKINVGLSLGGMMRDVITFKRKQLDLGTNSSIAYLECIAEYKYLSKSGTTHSFGFDFYIQTSLNKSSEFDYVVPTKNGTSFKSWNTGISNLYKNNNYWTFMYAFGKRNTLKLYLQQDFTVNNHPDIQTGIGYSIPF